MTARSSSSSDVASSLHSSMKTIPHILLCLGIVNNEHSVTVWGTKPDLQHWVKLPVQIVSPGSCACFFRCSHSRLITMGGQQGLECCTRSYLFKDSTWKNYADMNIGRRWAGVRVIGQLIVVIGGVDFNGRPVPNVEILDMQEEPNRRSWRVKAAQKSPSKWPILADDGRSIFCISDTGMIEKYDVQRDEWLLPPKIPDEVGNIVGCSAVCHASNLYLVGGFDHTCAILDLSTNGWETPQSKPRHSHSFGSALFSQGEILLFGGEGTDSIEKFQIKSKQWYECNLRMPCELDHHQVLDGTKL